MSGQRSGPARFPQDGGRYDNQDRNDNYRQRMDYHQAGMKFSSNTSQQYDGRQKNPFYPRTSNVHHPFRGQRNSEYARNVSNQGQGHYNSQQTRRERQGGYADSLGYDEGPNSMLRGSQGPMDYMGPKGGNDSRVNQQGDKRWSTYPREADNMGFNEEGYVDDMNEDYYDDPNVVNYRSNQNLERRGYDGNQKRGRPSYHNVNEQDRDDSYDTEYQEDDQNQYNKSEKRDQKYGVNDRIESMKRSKDTNDGFVQKIQPYSAAGRSNYNQNLEYEHDDGNYTDISNFEKPNDRIILPSIGPSKESAENDVGNNREKNNPDTRDFEVTEEDKLQQDESPMNMKKVEELLSRLLKRQKYYQKVVTASTFANKKLEMEIKQLETKIEKQNDHIADYEIRNLRAEKKYGELVGKQFKILEKQEDISEEILGLQDKLDRNKKELEQLRDQLTKEEIELTEQRLRKLDVRRKVADDNRMRNREAKREVGEILKDNEDEIRQLRREIRIAQNTLYLLYR